MPYDVITLADRGYRYLPSVFQYSAGIQALDGFIIRRINFARWMPMVEGFDYISAFLKKRGLPPTAFVACELRSKLPFSSDGFRAFNTIYADVLRKWGIFEGDNNPVARSNVCPEIDPPSETVFYSFSYLESDDAKRPRSRPSFVISGGAETISGPEQPAERIVAYRDISRAGMKRKVDHTFDEMTGRLSSLGLQWADTTAVQAYTVFDLYPHFLPIITVGGGAQNGLTWYPCRPPVQDVDFEMDCRGLETETFVTP